VDVTVIDGDRWRRIPGARVRLSHRVANTNRRGVIAIRISHRRPLWVSVAARGYEPRTIRADFRASRHVTVRIYRPALQWPLFGATPSRTQAQVHIRLHPPFRTVWSVDLGGLLEFPAVVDDGTAYIGNAEETIQAISIGTGKVLWRHPTPHGQMASSPAIFGDELVYHGMDGNVWVLDRATGRELWHFVVGSPIESSPIMRAGVDYFGAWNGTLYALDLQARKLRWMRDLGAKITSSAAIASGMLYIGDYAGRLWALSPKTGSSRWTGTVNGRIYATPAVADGRVFVASSDGDSMTAFTTNGRYLWRIQTGSYVYSSPAVWGGRVFFGSYGGVFYCVSAESGRTLWTIGAGGPISGAAVVVDGVAYVGSFAHRIVGVAARTGRIVESFPHGDYTPVSGNGMRLLLHGYSTLYAVEPR
jgi:outer membrane protein assembly factor BamB